MNIGELAPTDERDGRDPWGAERMFIGGQSGSGKSTLERKILDYIWQDEKQRHANEEKHNGMLQVVIDSKHDWKFNKLPFSGGEDAWHRLPLTDLRLVPPGRYIYRPSYPEIEDAGAHRIFLTALKRQYCTIVVDEAGDFGSSSPIRSLGKLVRQGRGKHVRLIAGSQRPAGIPLIFITEAQKLAAFYLQNDEDRKKLARYAGPIFLEPQTGYNFIFMDVRRRRAVKIQQAA